MLLGGPPEGEDYYRLDGSVNPAQVPQSHTHGKFLYIRMTGHHKPLARGILEGEISMGSLPRLLNSKAILQ